MKLLPILAVLIGSSILSSAAPATVELIERETTNLEQDELAVQALIKGGERIPVRAIDLHPESTFDGLPVNDTLIVGYRINLSEAASKKITDLDKRIRQKRIKLSRREDSLIVPNSSDLSKRQQGGPWTYRTANCVINNQWVLRWQAQIAKDHVCGLFAGWSEPSGGWYIYEELNWWDGNNNQWKRLTNHYGGALRMSFRINPGWIFDWHLCTILFSTIINTCHGTNPDCSGGSTSAISPQSPYDTLAAMYVYI